MHKTITIGSIPVQLCGCIGTSSMLKSWYSLMAMNNFAMCHCPYRRKAPPPQTKWRLKGSSNIYISHYSNCVPLHTYLMLQPPSLPAKS